MKNRKPLLIILSFLIMVACKEDKKSTEPKHNHVEAEKVSTPKKNLSPHTSSMTMVGDARIHIDYSSPGVRNRIVFVGLLPYDAVWQA